MSNFDYVKKAEEVIKSLIEKDRNGNAKIGVTTSQIRKFLTAVNSVSNKVGVYKVNSSAPEKLSEELAAEIKYIKIKLVYQAGRERKVKDFVDKADLLSKLDAIGNNTARFEEFARYVESLVAFHKYYGGRD